MAPGFGFLAEMNAFENALSHRRHRNDRYLQIQATRVYISLVFVCLIALGITLQWSKSTIKVVINDPTIDQVEKLTVDGECPCSRLGISYNTFVTLDINFHSVCQSDFVTDRWIQGIFPGINASWLFRADFRATASAQFLLLRSLCQLSNRHFQDNLINFYATNLVSPLALSRTDLLSTLNSSITQFQSNLPFQFQTQIDLLNRMIFANKWITGIQTVMQTRYWSSTYQPDFVSSIWLNYMQDDYVFCQCQRDYRCAMNAAIYEPTLLANNEYSVTPNRGRWYFRLPNFYAGCMPILSLFRSSLECFYNQTCIDRLLSNITLNQQFSAIPVENNSRFSINETLATIVNAMFIVNWTETISYENYFQTCAPKSCIYSTSKKRSFLITITEIIGLLGGIILGVRTSVYLCIRVINQHKDNHRPDRPTIPLKNRLFRWIPILKKYLITINKFRRRGANKGLLKHQIIGTRIYILIVCLCTFIFAIYTFITEDDQHETIVNPTELTYNMLSQTYSTNLQCPCTQICIDYSKFISLQPVFHPICSSSYVSDAWLNYTNSLADNYGDSRFGNVVNLGIPFQFMAAICDYSKKSIEEALNLFFKNQLVTFRVTSPWIFSLQIQNFIDTWILDTVNQYHLEIDLIQIISEGNKYLNFHYNFQFDPNRTTGAFNVIPKSYNNCSCDQSQICYKNLQIENIRRYIATEPNNTLIDEFFIGCSHFESLAQSSFSCFYNQTCIDAIENHLNATFQVSPVNVNYTMKPMDSINMENNETHEIVRSIIDRLMINQWKSNVSFSNYYNACAPSFCTYEYRSRRSFMIMILTVISLIDGLSTGIEIFILLMIRTIEKIRQYESRRTVKRFIVTVFQFETDEQIIRRVHLICLMFLLSAFYFISFLPSYQITVPIDPPSLSNYDILSKKYASQSFECSCTKFSITYETFLTIQPSFHPICSSVFVTDRWLDYVYQKTNSFIQFNQTDFYRTAYSQYQLLASFCQLSRQTVINGLIKLNKTSYINAQLLTREALRKEVETVIERYQTSAPRLFSRLMNLIREITEGNMLMTLYGTNWKVRDIPPLATSAYIVTEPVFYDSCNCGTSIKCTESSRNRTVACYPLEAFLHSTLSCFYDQQCIDADGIFPALKRSQNTSRFQLNTTFEALIEVLMVEEYRTMWSYENYFNDCSILSCSYSYQGRKKTIDILTSLVGLYGGLMIISECITVCLVRWYLHRKRNSISTIG